MTRFVSPNELQLAARDAYLGGAVPINDRDWALCVNFWAANIDGGLEVEACQLMARLFDCPLDIPVIRAIAEYQKERK
jgi:hypothetical protein